MQGLFYVWFQKRYVLDQSFFLYLAKTSKEKTARCALETPSCSSEYISKIIIKAREGMRYLLRFSTITDRQKLAQVKTFVEIAHSLHNNVDQRPAFRLKRKSHCISAVNKTFESCTLVESVRRSFPWI